MSRMRQRPAWYRQLAAALQKNFKLKLLSPITFLMELAVPCIFMLLLSIGYWLSDNDAVPAKSYVDSPVVLDETLYDNQLFCKFNPLQNPVLDRKLHQCNSAPFNNPLDCVDVGYVGFNGQVWSCNNILLEAAIDYLGHITGPIVPPDLDAYFMLSKYRSEYHESHWFSWGNKASLGHYGKLAIAGPQEITKPFREWLRNEFGLYDFVVDPTEWATANDAWGKAYMNSGMYWGILDLSELSPPNSNRFTIRLNYTSTPVTFRTVNHFTLGLGHKEYIRYITSGFASLQHTVNKYIASQYYSVDSLQNVSALPMPTKAYYSSEFLSASGRFIPLVAVFAFLYSLSRLLSALVDEKDKVRETMLIMGLPLWCFYASWLLMSMSINICAAALASVVLKSTLFNNASYTLMALLLFLFANTITALGMLLSVFFSKPRIAAIVGPLILFIFTVPFYAIPEGSKHEYVVLASVLPCTAFAKATSRVTSYASNGEFVGWGNLFEGEYPIILSIVMMLIDFALYLAMGWYLDRVLPSEYGVKSHPLFPCIAVRDFFARLCNRGNQDENPESRSLLADNGQQRKFRKSAAPPMASTASFSSDDTVDSTMNNSMQPTNERSASLRSPASGDSDSNNEDERQEDSGRPRGDSFAWRLSVGRKSTSSTRRSNQQDDRPDPDAPRLYQQRGDSHLNMPQQSGFEGGELPPVVLVDQLVKHFGSGSDRVTAVDHLNMQLDHRQITVLLGHNGAGKSTTMHAMIGLQQATSGAIDICGVDVRKNVQAAREHIGYCPQQNTIWPNLTVNDHLLFYARMKSSAWNVEALITETLKIVSLAEKRHAQAGTLSGGQKRKLCIGMALIGGSPFLLLDEPTAGLDVTSRRAVWEVLKKARESRCVLLSTHYMDEAELLGDKVYLMRRGKLYCEGTPNELKSQLGIGYVLQCVLTSPEAADDAIRGIRAAWPSEEDARRAAQLSTNRSDQPFVYVAAEEARAERRNNVLNVTLPPEFRSFATAFFEAFEPTISQCGVRQFAFKMTSLEDVFCRVALQADDGTYTAEDGDQTGGLSSPAVASSTPSLLDDALVSGMMDAAIDDEAPLLNADPNTRGVRPYRGSYGAQDDTSSGTAQDAGVDVEDAAITPTNPGFFTHLGALLLKRFRYARRDRRMLVFQLVMPIFFLSIALLILLIHPPTQPPLLLDGSMYENGPQEVLFTPTTATSTSRLASLVTDGGKNVPGAPITCDPAQPNSCIEALTDKLQAEHNVHASHPRFMSYGPQTPLLRTDTSMWFNTSAVLHNASAYHAIAEGFQMAANVEIQLRGKSPTATGSSIPLIEVVNFPMPMSHQEKVILSSIQRIVSAIFVLIPFTFIPANFVSLVVKEQECGAKHLQWIAGVNIPAFWVSSLLFDLAIYLATELLAVLVFVIFRRDEYIGNWENFAATFTLFFLYGVASIPMSYLLSFAFKKHTTAQTMVMMGNFFCGFLLVMAAQILSTIDKTRETNRQLCKFYRLIPGYALGEGIITLTGRELAGLILHKEPGAFDYLDYDQKIGGFFGGVGTSLVYLGATAPVLFFLLFVVEYGKMLVIRLQVRRAKNANANGGNDSDGDDAMEDEDVVKERAAVEDLDAADVAGVLLRGLRKEYKGGDLVAVQNSSFRMQSGEVFALLGKNGAGKSTTMGMLTGATVPTRGNAFHFGSSVVTKMDDARLLVGYCPQADALLDNLSVWEHLDLYGRLRGLNSSQRASEIEKRIHDLSLGLFRNTSASKLSGGNKRKLSLAIALMGNTRVVLLDEPTAGMDPVSRRDLWRSIKHITDSNRVVVLTTHHLEEVEALADRMAIMDGGRLRCFGGLLHVKRRVVGEAVEVTVAAARPSSTSDDRDSGSVAPRASILASPAAALPIVRERLQQLCGFNAGVEVLEQVDRRFTFSVTNSTIAGVLRALDTIADEGLVNPAESSIADVSVDQVFLKLVGASLADEQEEATS